MIRPAVFFIILCFVFYLGYLQGSDQLTLYEFIEKIQNQEYFKIFIEEIKTIPDRIPE
jgi:hypothetical protein